MIKQKTTKSLEDCGQLHHRSHDEAEWVAFPIPESLWKMMEAFKGENVNWAGAVCLALSRVVHKVGYGTYLPTVHVPVANATLPADYFDAVEEEMPEPTIVKG